MRGILDALYHDSNQRDQLEWHNDARHLLERRRGRNAVGRLGMGTLNIAARTAAGDRVRCHIRSQRDEVECRRARVRTTVSEKRTRQCRRSRNMQHHRLDPVIHPDPEFPFDRRSRRDEHPTDE
jgi:hypothetical protein